jgi:HlyD family secretion protein
MKKVIAAVVILIIFAGGFYAVRAYGAQRQDAALSDLQTVSAERGSLTAMVGATGVVRANQTATLSWRTSGTVAEVHVEVGDEVEAGFPLVTLDETSLPQNIILARADLTNAQKALDDLYETEVLLAQALQTLYSAEKAVLEADQALVRFDDSKYKDDVEEAREDIVETRDNLREAREDFEPYEDWDEDNSTRKSYKESLDDAQRAYDDAVRRLRLIELEKEAASSSLELSQARFNEAQKEYERLQNGPDPDDVSALEARAAAAEATIQLAQLLAPFDGIVTRIDMKRADQAITGQPAFRVDDLSSLLVDVRISEVDINRISLDQQVSLSFDAIPGQDYTGRIGQVSQVGTALQGIVEFLVTVRLENPDEKVKPGMTAAVNVVVNQLDNVLLVPNRAVRLDNGQRVVYVLRSNNLEMVPITLGATSDTNSEVISGGLQSGDQIVLNPPTSFSSGRPPFMR